jgi:predicted AlkP superfamily phosphohydrolase/phosphomutase
VRDPRHPTPRLVIVGVDGAAWDFVAPWIDADLLPTLASLRARSCFGRARSTTPAVTFPAWTSFATACEPQEHGIFDFSLRTGYGMRFVSAADRAAPSIWKRLADAGQRVCVYNLPASFPPEPLPGGVFISGFDTPVATAIDPSFVHPRELHAELTRRFGPLVISDLNEARIDAGWHARALSVLTRDVKRRGEIARHLLERESWDVFFVLFGESDTAAHHFWAFGDPRSPRHRPSEVADGLLRVYREIDAALGRLIHDLPDTTALLLLSDHGFGGAGTRVVSLNRFLHRAGFLAFAPDPTARLLGLARHAALRLLPRRLQGALARGAGARAAARLEEASRFGGIDWARTSAFSEDLSYFPSIWINLAGREPLGRVAPRDYDETCARITAALEAWRDPDTGARIVSRVRRRAELYGDAPLAERAPDLVLDLELEDGYTTAVARSGGHEGAAVWRIAPSEYAGAKGTGMNGTHRLHGLYAWIGAGHPVGPGPDVALAELGAGVLQLFGLSAGGGTDRAAAPAPGKGSPVYTAAEERVLEERLRALGYLE